MLSADFVKVAETKDIQPSNIKAIDIEGGERICIANVEGKYYAYVLILEVH
jgi:nitrite reductase/ring-hydroxylating ferredoxin subunit